MLHTHLRTITHHDTIFTYLYVKRLQFIDNEFLFIFTKERGSFQIIGDVTGTYNNNVVDMVFTP